MIRCLHIANDFSLTKVHKNLYLHLDELGVSQIIFNPVRHNTPVGNNHIDFQNVNSEIIYSSTINKSHRFFFRKKINFLFADLDSKYDLKSVDVVHATTLFSDGAIALKIFKKYKTPYIVAVRGTDVSLFLKYRPDLIFLLREILVNAQNVIFVGKALKKQFFSKSYVKIIRPKLNDKIRVIFNGIDNFWLSKTLPTQKIKPTKILYIGRFDGNKNTIRLIEAILRLKKEHPNVKLELVGTGGENEDKVIELSYLHQDFIKYHGPIFDKEELLNIYRDNHIFAMPSQSETLGLVYLEAISQGLPVLCSKNQGVDGIFDCEIGKFVNPKSVDSIYRGLTLIFNEYDTFEIDKIDFSIFRWSNIASEYLHIYKSICDS